MTLTYQLMGLEDALEKDAGIGTSVLGFGRKLIKRVGEGYEGLEDSVADAAGSFTHSILRRAISTGAGKPGEVERLIRLAVRNPKALVKKVQLGGGRKRWSDAAFYSPYARTIYLGEDLKNVPAALAHEIGHSIKPTSKLGRWAKYRVSKYLHDVDLASKPMSDFAEAINNMWYVAPEEIRASLGGYKYLRHIGQGRLQALKAFAGVPSYILPGLVRLATRAGVAVGGAAGTGYGAYKGYQALTGAK